MITERQSIILSEIVSKYISSGEPVSSKLLVSDGMDVSTATIRNEMHHLEDQGFITQPYTSSGRVPTDEGYKYYLENYMQPELLSAEEQMCLKKWVVGRTADEQGLKNLAKELAGLASTAVLLGFSKDNVYFTGLSLLLREPEFIHQENIFSLTDALDRRESEISEMVNTLEITDEPRIVIGSESPLGESCSVVTAPFTFKGKKSMIGLIGPLRMNYGKNYSLMVYTKSLLT